MAVRDVAFVATFTFYDPAGNASSDSVGLHKSPLHELPKVRLESLGLPDPVTLGFDGQQAWMARGNTAVHDPARLAFSRFNMVSNLFWFSLPFGAAEWPTTVTDLGEQSTGGRHWARLKIVPGSGAPEAPGDWFVLYLDPESALIDHVFAHITAEFLTHSLWVGKWLDYQEWDGIKKERRRQFFPADAEGTIIGAMVAEELVEDVRFNNHFPTRLFEKPLAVDGGQPT